MKLVSVAARDRIELGFVRWEHFVFRHARAVIAAVALLTAGFASQLPELVALGGGYRFETVIINQPESAILGTGGITDRVLARDGQIVIKPIMTYYFTYDHRIISGAVAAKFIASLIQVIENPSILLAMVEYSS